VSHAGETFDLGFVRAPGGDAFVIVRRADRTQERFPMTDEGWSQAWARFSALEPAAVRPRHPWYRLPLLTIAIVFGVLYLVGVAIRIIRAATSGSGRTELPASALLRGAVSSPEGTTIFRDDFSSTDQWPVEDRKDARLAYGRNGYEILVRRPLFTQLAVLRLGESSPGMSVQVDAVALQAPRGPPVEGVGCFYASHTGWLFIVGGAGWAAIARDEDGRKSPLDIKPFGSAIDLGRTTRIRGECVAGPSATRLRLYVNDKLVLSSTDSPSPGFGLVVLAAAGSADVLFDDVWVRRL
jgi:hypothetical protein